jgi:hypothetical protein
MKLYEMNKSGQMEPVPDGEAPKDKRWTARGAFLTFIPVTMVIVFIFFMLR